MFVSVKDKKISKIDILEKKQEEFEKAQQEMSKKIDATMELTQAIFLGGDN